MLAAPAGGCGVSEEVGEPVRSPPLAPENPLTFNVSPPCPPRVQLSQQGPLSLHQSKESLLYELQSQVWETSPEARQASNWGGREGLGGLFSTRSRPPKCGWVMHTGGPMALMPRGHQLGHPSIRVPKSRRERRVLEGGRGEGPPSRDTPSLTSLNNLNDRN